MFSHTIEEVVESGRSELVLHVHIICLLLRVRKPHAIENVWLLERLGIDVCNTRCSGNVRSLRNSESVVELEALGVHHFPMEDHYHQMLDQ